MTASHSSPLMVTPAMRSNTLMMAEPSSLFNPAALMGLSQTLE